MSNASVNIHSIRRPSQSELAILVPVYQNAATVAELAVRITCALMDFRADFQIIFVVDASPDDSWRIIKQLARDDGRICGILLRHNQGQHRALMVGMQQIRARWVVMMDADLQDPPELLPELIDECARTDKTVFARRNGQYQPWGRMMSSRMFKYLLGRIIDVPINVGSYFVVPASVAKKIRHAGVRKVQMVVMARVFSPGWSAVSYVRKVRDEGKSAYSSWGRLRSAVRGLVCVWECRRWKQGNVSVGVENWREASYMILDRVNI